jgi:GT2 family glycosyltransferase
MRRVRGLLEPVGVLLLRGLDRVREVYERVVAGDAERAGADWSWSAQEGDGTILVAVRMAVAGRLRMTVAQDGRSLHTVDLGVAGAFELRIAPPKTGGVSRFTLRADAPAVVAGVGVRRQTALAAFLRRLPRPPSGRREAFEVFRRVAVDVETGAVRSAPFAAGRRASLVEFYRCAVVLAADEEAADPLAVETEHPVVSIVVPVYDADPAHLDDLVRSFALQTEGLAELILCDDASPSEATRRRLARAGAEPGVRLIANAANLGIAGTSNAGLAVARGDWVTFLDHDDALAPHAIARIVRALRAHPETLFLHTDEMITGPDLDIRSAFLKPAWDEVLLSGVNYVNHLSVYRRDRLLEIGGFAAGFEGSQDYDLVLRYTAGLEDRQILHLPYPAYLWRRSEGTYSVRHLDRATASARRALVRRFGVATVEAALGGDLHRPRLDGAIEAWPRVSVIVPNRNAVALMRTLLDGLAERTDYPDLEIVIYDNGSDDPEIHAVYEAFRRRFDRVVIEIEPSAFNFSRSINRGVRHATGELLLLLNNDIEMIEPGWLKEMVSCLRHAGAGVVGAKLLYPDRRLQHAGVIAGLGGLAGHWYCGRGEGHPGPMGRLWVRQTLSCVTGACMLVTRACWSAVGPLDEEAFAIAYNDVDFCLRATKAGFGVIWTPFACLFHHESATRGSDDTPANIERFRREQDNLRRRHATDVLEDPAFSPWYARSHSEPFAILRDDLPAPRHRGMPAD